MQRPVCITAKNFNKIKINSPRSGLIAAHCASSGSRYYLPLSPSISSRSYFLAHLDTWLVLLAIQSLACNQLFPFKYSRYIVSLLTLHVPNKLFIRLKMVVFRINNKNCNPFHCYLYNCYELTLLHLNGHEFILSRKEEIYHLDYFMMFLFVRLLYIEFKCFQNNVTVYITWVIMSGCLGWIFNCWF